MLAKPIQFIRNVYNLLSKRWHANNRHPLQTHASTWIKTERICHQNTPIPHYQGSTFLHIQPKKAGTQAGLNSFLHGHQRSKRVMKREKLRNLSKR